MNHVTSIGIAIAGGLGASALAVVLLVLIVGVPIWAGLALLAVLDGVIIRWGYRAVVRSVRQSDTRL